MSAWRLAPAGSRRQAVRRRLDALSSRLLHRTILDFRLRLVLLAALTLPFILLGGCVHALASGQTWRTSAYLVYGLLFRVPSLGAIRADEPAASALVLNAVFLFGVFGFAILLGLIGEEVKGTVKALRAGGTPLDLYGHVLVLNFTADPTAVALLRQLAKDVGNQSSPLYGRPIVVLASRPPAVSGVLAAVACGGGAAEQSGGGGGGDITGAMKRVLADALQVRGGSSCEWHLRIGSSCSIEDLARVCAATSSYIVLLADPRVATLADAISAGVAPSLQAQSLMCVSLALNAATSHSGVAARGGAEVRARSRSTSMVGGRDAGASGSWGQQQATIVVQSPISGHLPHLPPPGPAWGPGGGPISVFRSVASGEGCQPLVVEVCDSGILNRLVAQTVLQPGVATVMSRLFGGGQNFGAFRWVDWPGLHPPVLAAGAAAVHAPSSTSATSHPRQRAPGRDVGGADGGVELGKGTGLRQRRLMTVPRNLSYNTLQSSMTAMEAVLTAGKGGGGGGRGDLVASPSDPIKASDGCGPSQHTFSPSGDDEQGDIGRGAFLSCCTSVPTSPGRNKFIAVASTAIAARSSCTADSTTAPAAASTVPSSGVPGRLSSASLLPEEQGRGGSFATFAQVRAAMEAAAVEATAASIGSRSLWRLRHAAPVRGGAASAGPLSLSLAASFPPLSRFSGSAGSIGGSSPLVPVPQITWPPCPPGSCPVLVGYKSAATGTLLLNPRDTSLVYPGDKLVLLVSEESSGVRGSHAVAGLGCTGGPSGGTGGGGADGGKCSNGGWRWWWRRRRGEAGAAANGSHWPESWDSGHHSAAVEALGSPLQSESSNAVLGAVEAAAKRMESPPMRPVLQRWGHGPLDKEQAPPFPSTSFSETRMDTSAMSCTTHIFSSGTAPAVPAATPVPAHSAANPVDSMVDDGGASCLEGRPLTPAPSGLQTPPAPPLHIIVISRTATAIREVITGLQEFAPTGSTIALVTHEPSSDSVRQVGADVADPAVGAARSLPVRTGGGVSQPVVSSTVSCMYSAAPAFQGNGQGLVRTHGGCGGGGSSHNATVVMSYPSTTWPVSERNLVLAGLAAATAILVARDSGLLPHEADATALSTVLQLHKTLTDPTRLPRQNNHRSPPPQLYSFSRLVGGGAFGVTAAVPDATTAAATDIATTITGAATKEGAASPPPLGSVTSLDTVAVHPPLHDPPLHAAPGVAVVGHSCAATPASSPTDAAPPTYAVAAASPLHVVVSLHSSRARDTLSAFLKGLCPKPPFTLEAFVPEEYRALLLASVVRQPRSHHITTELLSDRPGSPEVYLVPPERLLAAAAAAAAVHGQYGEGPFSSCARLSAFSQFSAPVPPCPSRQREPCLTPRRVAHVRGSWGHLEPEGVAVASPLLCSGVYDMRFSDVAVAARAAGCTAIGVLRGSGTGAAACWETPGRRGCGWVPKCRNSSSSSGCNAADVGGGGSGSSLQLAPPPEVLLKLRPGDRLVVLAAEPV